VKKNEIEDIEIHLLLEAIFQRYGHDFRNYAQSTIKRRIHMILQKSDCKNIMAMTEKALHDESFFQWILTHFSITVTEWFRAPLFYKGLREKVLPYLKTFPFIKLWHAGCATGEEAFSLAIVLKEEGLYDKATVFATDFNDDALRKAKQGIFSAEDVKAASLKYQETGGNKSFSEYVHTKYDSAIVDSTLRKNITFANHNLATDSVFGEMHLILCRNVLIYFDKALKNRVFKLFHDSLIYKGFLCLGDQESLEFSEMKDQYKIVDREQKIYQKISR
jgi:chemotaxis protein methyltransferase CheR